MAEAVTAGAATGVAMAERMPDRSGRSRAAQSLSSAALLKQQKVRRALAWETTHSAKEKHVYRYVSLKHHKSNTLRYGSYVDSS